MAQDVYTATPFIAEMWNTEAVIEGLKDSDDLFRTVAFNLAPVGAKSAHVILAGAFVANDMSSNEVVDQNGSESDVEVIMDKHKHVSTVVRDLDELQSPAGVANRLVTIGGMTKALRKKIDSDFVVALAAITPDSGHSISNSTAADWIDLADSGDTVNEVVAKIEALMLRADTVLNRADVVETERTYLVPPELKELLFKSEKWTSMDKTGQPGALTGEFGAAFGNRVIKRNDASMRTYVAQEGEVAAHTILTCYLYQSSIMAAGIQQAPRMQGEYTLKALGTRIVSDCVYGFKEARTESLVKFQLYFTGDPWSLAG